MKVSDDLLAGAYTVWYRDVLRLLRDRSRMIGALITAAIMLIGVGFGLGGVIGKVGGPAAAIAGAASAPGVPFAQFMFPAMLCISVLMFTMQSTMSMVEDREFGYLRKILVAPVTRTSVALGKVAGGVTLATILAGPMLIMAPFLGIQLTVFSALLSLVVLIVLAATITSLGVLIASRQTSMQGFMVVNMLVMMPLMLLSLGSFLPSFGSGMMATAFKVASQFNPVTYGIDAMRQIMLGGAMPASMALHPPIVDVAVLGVLFVVFLVPGVALFSKQD